MSTRPAVNRIIEEFSISRMTEHDLLDVVEIEERSSLSRWGWGAYYAELQGPNRDLMLVTRPRRKRDPGSVGIVGYIVARLVAGELHINNVAVRDQYRRRGIASVLLNQIIEQARRQEATVAFLEVRSGNVAAQALYEKCGFRRLTLRRNYYSAPLEDALVMTLSL